MSERAESHSEFESGHVVAERYEILEVIGHGMTGTVYRARDLHVDSDHEIVALKAVHPHLHTDRQIFGRFRREVRILSQLDGPHLCKLLDVVEDAGLLMIALEYVDGLDLDDYLKDRTPLSLNEIVVIMRQICAALDVAHRGGIVHRDLKPSNVLIEGIPRSQTQRDGIPKSFLNGLRVRVVDFGLAKLVQGDHTGTVLTEQDMIFGTPDYMAPEQVSGEELDARCDIYAAGVMLFQMVVGKLPFDTPGPLTTMAAHLNQPPPLPSREAPGRDIPAAVDDVILRVLHKDRDARYESAGDLAKAFAAACSAREEDDAVAQTQLDHSPALISTTMESHKDEAALAMKGKGAKVRVVVKDAPPSQPEQPTPRRTTPRPPPATRPSDGERRLWLFLALAAAIAALALGIFLGVR
jgi:serine/threonine-protein kinase